MNLSMLVLLCSRIFFMQGGCHAEPYIGCPYPCPCPCPPIPMGFGWAWVRYYCSWVGMGGHRFCASLHPTPNRSQTSLDARNTLTKKCSGLKPVIVNDFLFIRSNQDLVYAGTTHYTFFEYMGAI
jgi:hypothetical protein